MISRSSGKAVAVIGRMAFLSILASAIISLSSGVVDSAEFVIDTSQSEFVVQLEKAGIAAALAHNHVIRATQYAGIVTFVRQNPADAFIQVEVQVASLLPDEPEVRTKYGLAKPVSEGDREKIRTTMLSADQLDADRYPTMSFVSTGIKEQSEENYILTGDLTIHGVTRAVTFPVIVHEESADRIHGRATIEFKQSDFGIKPFSAMFGAFKNKDEAVLHVDIAVMPQP